MKDIDLDKFKDAYDEEFKFFNENILMLSRYGQRLVSTIRDKKFKSIISLGIGLGVVSKNILTELVTSLDKYLIIEGAQEIIEKFQSEIPLYSNICIIHTLFEEFSTDEKFDAIEMGFVLEHVDNPLSIIKQYREFLKPDGSIFIAVPNARSLHRLIGNNAGMLNNLYKLSESDLECGHRRYFDMNTIIKLISEAGLKVLHSEGILLKPFSTSQLESLKLSPNVINALSSVGESLPEISNAIYIEANL